MKYIKYILLLVATLLLVGCTTDNINYISYDNFIDKVDNKENMILFFGENDLLESTLNQVLNDYELEAYTINTKKLSDEELSELKKIVDFEDLAICFIVNGQDPSVLTHLTDEYTTKEDIINSLTNLGFIKANKG